LRAEEERITQLRWGLRHHRPFMGRLAMRQDRVLSGWTGTTICAGATGFGSADIGAARRTGEPAGCLRIGSAAAEDTASMKGIGAGNE